MSAPGRSELLRRSALARGRGFTLLEILVVVVLIAIATAASLTYLRPSPPDAAKEARRLAAVLERLGLEARQSGRRMAWRCEGAELFFETWQSDIFGSAGAWEPWAAMPRTALADGLRFGALSLDRRDADCGARVTLPVFGASPEFALDILGAGPGAGRRIVGDAAGSVLAEAAPE